MTADVAESGLKPGDSRPFTAKFPSGCAECDRTIYTGQTVRFVGGVVVHARCDGTEWGTGGDDEFNAPDEKVPEPVIIGARQPKLCKSCYLEHAGTCEW